MKRTILTAMLLATLATASAHADWTVGPALVNPTPGGKPMDTVAAKTENYDIKMPVSDHALLLKRARLNAIIEVDETAFVNRLDKFQREDRKVKGWYLWNEGLDDEHYTSFVLIKSEYFDRAAHPMSYVRGVTVDKLGQKVKLKDLFPDLTVEEVEAKTKEQMKERNIPLFPFAKFKKIPSEFYIGKDHHVYVMYQLYEIAPYAAGIISVDLGVPTSLQKQ